MSVVEFLDVLILEGVEQRVSCMFVSVFRTVCLPSELLAVVLLAPLGMLLHGLIQHDSDGVHVLVGFLDVAGEGRVLALESRDVVLLEGLHTEEGGGDLPFLVEDLVDV